MNLATLAEQNLREFGEYERLVFEEQRFTNRALYEMSRKLCAGLERLGLRADDKVVVLLRNCPEVLVSYPAIWRAGCVVIPVLFLLDKREISYILKNSETKAIITSPDLLDKVRLALDGATSVKHIILTGSSAEGTPESQVSAGAVELVSFERLIAEHEPQVGHVARSDSDLAVILYTSGTTGAPKGVMQTHRNLYAAVMNSHASQPRRNHNITSLLVLPLAHSFGLGVLIGGYLFAGKAILMRWFDPEEALHLIEKHKVQGMAGVPTMFVYMLNHPNAHGYDTSSIERWLVGGAPMPVEQQLQIEKQFGGTMYVGYGLTESCPGLSGDREGYPRKPGSCGLVHEGVELKIIDEQGLSVARGEPGEICARGQNISPGYYRMPEQTAETFRDGWLHTGDIGYLDEDGYLFVVERKKDLIIRGGFNVYPKDVEEALSTHPAVLECAVVGVPDPVMGEEVCAFVVKKREASVTAEELIGHCRAQLARYKTPKQVEFVEALPKTNIGKVQKKELRRLAQTMRQELRH